MNLPSPFPNLMTCETDVLLYEIYLALAGTTGSADVSGLVNKTVVQTLNDGNNTVNHAINKIVVGVFVVDSSNNKIEVEWSLIDNNNINVYLAGGGPVTNAIINVIAKESSLNISQIIQGIDHGNNTVAHNLNATVVAVTVLDSGKNKIDIEWTIIDVNNINIVLAGSLDLLNCYINIFSV